MRNYWFEIVRRAYHRFSWLLVQDRDGRRRVLAMSHRDYKSKSKAIAALVVFRGVVAEAPIIDATGQRDDELRQTRFELGPAVVPLVVGEPFDDEDLLGSAVVAQALPRASMAADGVRGGASEAASAQAASAQTGAAQTGAAQTGAAEPATAATKTAATKTAATKTAATKTAATKTAATTARSGSARRSGTATKTARSSPAGRRGTR